MCICDIFRYTPSLFILILCNYDDDDDDDDDDIYMKTKLLRI